MSPPPIDPFSDYDESDLLSRQDFIDEITRRTGWVPHPSTIKDWIRKGRIETTRRGKYLAFPRSQLDSLLSSFFFRAQRRTRTGTPSERRAAAMGVSPTAE